MKEKKKENKVKIITKPRTKKEEKEHESFSKMLLNKNLLLNLRTKNSLVFF